MEADVKLLADRLASAVEATQSAFALFDDQDCLVLCNDAYRQFLGGSVPEPLVGRPYVELLDAWIHNVDMPTDSEREAFRRERLERRHDAVATTFDVRLRDGRSLRVVDRRTPEGGTVKTIWDLTDEVRIAEELREARIAAEAASRAKSEFLSSMSHELRTPLNAILGFAQLLQKDRKEPLTARHRERVDHIVKGGEHLLHLINDILDLSGIESGSVPMSIEAVGVREVLEHVIATLEPMAARAGVRLVSHVPPDLLRSVAVDRTRFAQVLLNFGSNAIKYNRPEGEVNLVVSSPYAERVRVAVRDAGLGIPADKQAKLFQPFQRAGQETGPIEGTGIGLFITKRLAELMHGEVGFQSVEGEGSEFWVEVPLHDEDAPKPVSMRGDTLRITGPSALGQRAILYVEDNPANVAFMRDLVSSLDDFELIAVDTAEAGILLAHQRRPDVIVMDINLPGLSGFDALRALRDDPMTRNIPIIALSAAASPADRQRGLKAGFHRYLTKPVDVEHFIATVEALV